MTRVALITGGQQGIGLGIATALQGAGWRIAIAANLLPDDTRVAQTLSSLPGSTYHHHDLDEDPDDPALIKAIEAEHGPITTFVSNAGVPAMQRGDILDLSKASFDRCMTVNLRAAFFLAQTVARHMRAAPGTDYRSMHFITSVSADMASIDRAEYCMSKAAAAMMVKCLAAALAADSIGVFELRPGIIETDMTAGVHDRYDAPIRNGLVPTRRWGQPADIGDCILPLARGDMAYATGAVIPVDGGLSIPRL